MESNKQTAVEWLYDTLCDKGYFNKLPISEFKEALQMEKEQIEKACYDCYYKEERYDVRNYYNETYKK